MTSIARRNTTMPSAHEAAWNKYTAARRPGWTWTPPVRQRFCPFASFGEQCAMIICFPMLLVLFLLIV